jgi:hypothetical protein
MLGIDISERMLERAGEHAARGGLENVSYELGDAQAARCSGSGHLGAVAVGVDGGDHHRPLATADATRLMDPARTSPTANTAGTDVMNPSRGDGESFRVELDARVVQPGRARVCSDHQEEPVARLSPRL